MSGRVFSVVSRVFLVLTMIAGAGSAADLDGGPLIHRPDSSAVAPNSCTIGTGLGSSLLIPYFEVDLSDPTGVTTLISINNGINGKAIVRVILWTDWGIPTLAFDVFLDSFDLQPINVRYLLRGELPVTGIGADLSAFENCHSLPPTYPVPALTPGHVSQLQTAHTGQAGHIDGKCYGENHGDQIARGYITVDVVDQCSGAESYEVVFSPVNTSYPYFAEGGGPDGIAVHFNRLWGDVFYIDYSNNYAQGGEAIALWADPVRFTGSWIYTFYGNFSAYDGRDERVPLPYAWDQRFLNGGAFDGGTDLIVFSTPMLAHPSPVTCGTHPSWWPLEATLSSMNEDASGYTSYSDELFPLVTQKVSVADFSPPYNFGWIQLWALPRQMWVQPTFSALGRLSIGLNGKAVAFLCDESPPTPLD